MSSDDAAHRGSNLIQPASAVPNNAGAKQSRLSQSSLTPPVKYLEYSELVEVCQALGGTPGRVPSKGALNSTTMSGGTSGTDEKHVSVGTQPDDEEKQLNFSPNVLRDTPQAISPHNQTSRWLLQCALEENIMTVIEGLLPAAETPARGHHLSLSGYQLELIAPEVGLPYMKQNG